MHRYGRPLLAAAAALSTAHVAAQEARATAELKRHSHLLPRELDQAGWKLGERSESSLPFVR